ncbi:syntaxin 5 [Dermatophagoides pteronyssinus]|uniref:Syntaxin-5 n=2 Tax=Dermatophagoides pteronyssinus TaxID=6956 RepID=A0ABQ8IZG7_DERPT|nr:syntaxin-5-like [Dermatophagoides pteronyssinus]KAH9415667.1 Syntaxin-5 [Dermatophagoides pteronyssinus]
MVRDRTSEFMVTVRSMAGRPQYLNGTAGSHLPMELRARKGTNQIQQNGSSPLSNPQSQQYGQFSRFMSGSRSIARDLYLTYQKLEKINMMAQKKSMFDDEESSKEFNELIYIIKQDIQSLNQQIERLRQLQLETQSSSNSSGHNVRSHTKNVVLTLQHQLASISNSFRDTLEVRSENIKKVKKRREQFSFGTVIQPPLASRAQQQQGSLPHSHSASNLRQQQQQQSQTTVIDFGDTSNTDNGNNYRGHRHNNSMSLAQTQTLLQFPDQTNEYLEDRANTMQSIESTIVELGTIFNQLATMVQQQEEMITRIDANVTDTMMNVEQAHDSLLQYLTSVTNNRWLIIKVFAVLFIFFLIFVLFAA